MRSELKTVLISARDSGTPAARSYAITVEVEGEILDDRNLTPVESQEISEIAGQYEMVLDQRYQPQTAGNYLEILGFGLFHLIFEKIWGQIRSIVSNSKVKLIISSDIPEILNLPWEIMRPPDEDLLGFDPAFSILRLPEQHIILAGQDGQLSAGQLRVLFAAFAPKQSFNYSREEESFIKALEGLDIVWDSCNLGTFDELARQVDGFRPMIVHLVGQGVAKDGQNCFAFEGSDGTADLKSPAEIQKVMQGVQCVFMSGHQGKNFAILAAICRETVKAGLPISVAWPGSVKEGESIISAFYRSLASGQSIDDALISMRQEILLVYKSCAVLPAFPYIFSRSSKDEAFDLQQGSGLLKSLLASQMSLPGTTEGYCEDFVGRRRDVQRLLPALREGALTAVVITGLQGSGKSVLAVWLAGALEADGFHIISLYSSKENPLSAARLMEAISSAFLRVALYRQTQGQNELAAGLQEAAWALRTVDSSAEHRLVKAVESLNLDRFLLVLDDFEVNLDKSWRIIDPEMSAFYKKLLNSLSISRAIITCERLPEDVLTLPKKAREHTIDGLSKADFFRFMHRDGAVAGRLRTGDLVHQSLFQIYETIGGLPQCMDRIRKVLDDSNTSKSANKSKIAAKDPKEICESYTARLFGSLDSESRKALCNASVYAVPINLAGLEAVTGIRQEYIMSLSEEWTKRSLAFRTINGLLVVRGDLRIWLKERLGPEELKKAHEAAGDFLQDSSQICDDLGLTRLDLALEARAQYLIAYELEKSIAITNRISSILMGRGLYSEVRKLNQELLEHANHPKPMIWIAQAFLEQGNYNLAQDWYERCLKFPARSDEDAADAWHGIALAYLNQGKYDLAGDNFQKALEAYRRQGDNSGEVEALKGLASLKLSQGELESAREELQMILEIQTETGDQRGLATALQDLIDVHLRLKDHAAARENLLESAKIFRKLNHPAAESAALYDLASLDLENENFDSANDEFRRALEIRQVIGDQAGEAAALHSLAMVNAKKGDIKEAGRKFQKALNIYQLKGDKSGEAAAFFQLGILAIQLNHLTEGMKLLALSGIILRSAGSQEVRNVEPVVERMASQMKYTQDQFAEIVRKAAHSYRVDRGWGLVGAAFGFSYPWQNLKEHERNYQL
jgi:tetratricopeptide (TPR) repeat protein